MGPLPAAQATGPSDAAPPAAFFSRQMVALARFRAIESCGLFLTAQLESRIDLLLVLRCFVDRMQVHVQRERQSDVNSDQANTEDSNQMNRSGIWAAG